MKDVLIYDTTLRDGCQAEDISFTLEDKLRIAAKLEELGVDEGGDGLAVLGDDDAVLAELDLVEHFAEVLAEGDGGGFGDHGAAPG